MKRASPERVRDLIGLPSIDIVYREARLGRIPHVHLGRRRLFYEEPILRWLESQSRGSEVSAPEPVGAA